MKNKIIKDNTKTKRDNILLLFSLALIIALGFAIYSNSLKGEFIWDDEFLIKENVYIRNWAYMPKLFTENIMAGARKDCNSYRPLQLITYLLNYTIGRLDVRVYHITNILLHILVALCIYWLADILFKDRLLALFTSILFVTHPIHTEAVSYISGRADILVGLFIILAFISYVRYTTSNRILLYILMSLSYLCALFSKEIGLILPALLILYHYILKTRARLKNFFSILFISIIYLILRFSAVAILIPPTSPPTALLQRIPGFFVAIVNYIRLLILPLHLHMEYGARLFNFTNPIAILGMLILLLFLLYGFKEKKDSPIISFGILWFFITLLPQSNLYPLNTYMAEHWLYIPSIGFFLIVAKGLTYLYRKSNLRRFGLLSIASLSVFYSLLTIRQNTYWREPITFYERTLKYAPNSARVCANLGATYAELAKYKKAIELNEKAIEINPNYDVAYYNLGNVYSNLEKYQDAINLYKKVIEINPNYAEAYNNLGNVYSEFGKNEEAISLYKKAIEINPYHIESYNNLGIVYSEIGRNNKAISLYNKAIAINPNYAKAYSNLGNVYYKLGEIEKAKETWRKALQLDPMLKYIKENLEILERMEKR